MPMTTRTRIQNLTVNAMLIALIALMGFVPFLGFIPLGASVSITIIHLPVLLGAALLSTRSATLLGLSFGLVSLLVVVTNPTPQPIDLFFVNPLISVLPRILFGLFAGILFSFTRRFANLQQYGLLSLFAFLATVFHTVLVLSMLWLFASAELSGLFGNLVQFIWYILSLNGLIEAMLSALLIPILTLALRRIRFVQQLQR
jgi:uncharacterized membrane protein